MNLIPLAFFVATSCFCSEYHLEIHQEGDFASVEHQLMRMWTLVDMLRAINLDHQEKLSFLPRFVEYSIVLGDVLRATDVQAKEEQKALWLELFQKTLEAFDDLYDMLSGDEIGFVRTVLRQSMQLVGAQP